MSTRAGAATATAGQDLSMTINPSWALTTPGGVTLTRGQTAFQPFQATAVVGYQVRTTPAGSGTITLRMTNDFLPAGGPSVANGSLTYRCGPANFGIPCSSAQTASLSIETPVLSLPGAGCTGAGRPCSGQDPNSLSLTFTLIDDPLYATGTYSANVTFTISAI